MATDEKPGKRRMWKLAKKKPLAPAGKVPPGVKGLTRRRGGALQSNCARQWEVAEEKNVGTWVSRSPAWALSVAFHLVAAVILMNVVYFTQKDRIGQVFRMTLRAAAPGGQMQGDQDNGIDGKDNEDSAPSGEEIKDVPVTPGAGEVKKNTITSTAPPVKIDMGEASGFKGPGGIYAGRGGAGRGNALRQYGGDGQSEQAVVDGLEWLAQHQSKDGAWDPDRYETNCPKGDVCDSEQAGIGMYSGATTGLSLLAFLGAGYSHKDDHLRPANEGGPVTHAYSATIDKALKFLCRKQAQDGCIDTTPQKNLYVHGIAGLAVVEAYSITHDAALRPHAQKVVNFLVESQQDTGGWDYSNAKTNRSDTSITSWAVMIMRSARAANLAVPKRAWDRARRFMHSATNYDDGNIAYAVVGPPTRIQRGCNAMTALGMTTRVYLGMPEDQELTKKFTDEMQKVSPRFDEIPGSCPNWGQLMDRKGHGHYSLYYTYYATLAFFHHGGEPWEKWNQKMRECTIPTQRKTGHAKGSWDPLVWDGAYGGRIYTTAFNVMNLEVYYRYLPVYQVGAEFGLAKLVSDEEWEKVLSKALAGKFDEIAEGTEKDDPADVPADEKPKPPVGERGVGQLIEDLEADDMMTRRNAAKALALGMDPAGIPAMIAAVRAERTSLKPVLVEYLGSYTATPELVTFLIDELASESSRVRTAAAEALKRSTGQTTFGSDVDAWKRWQRDWDKKTGKK